MEGERMDGQQSIQPEGDAGRPTTLPCAGCGGPVDPLRAARVAIFREQFRYFCSVECRESFNPLATQTPLPVPRRSTEVASVPEPPHRIERRDLATAQALAAVESDIVELASAPVEEPGVVAADELPDVIVTTDVGVILLGVAICAGGLSAALLLAGPSSMATTARVVLAVTAAAALTADAFTGDRSGTDHSLVASIAAPVGAAVLALVTRLMNHPAANQAATLAAIVAASLAATTWLMRRALAPAEAERLEIGRQLDCAAHRVVGEEVAPIRSLELRPGEEILIEAGHRVPADAVITAGTARVRPWIGARRTETRSEGESIVAGAEVIEGRLRAVTSWTGNDRAWMRLTNDFRRRADVTAAISRSGRMLAVQGALLAAGVAAFIGFASDLSWAGTLALAIGVYAAISHAGVAQIAGLHVGRTVLAALRRGIAFRSAGVMDQTGSVTNVVFCARGTLLMGEPEVASIEAFGDNTQARVLALVAGAQAGAVHPVAIAVQRAARARDVRPDGVRSPTELPGLGVTAVAANGSPLVVGSRALMLRERISVATAERHITELEGMGRTVMLVALGGRLIGALGLQDGLRPGARAAVQHVLDVHVEPVLLSGDARETSEALGRALDIDHIRPEVLPTERGAEVTRLKDAGAKVAVVGHSPTDDIALSAADASIVLGSAGSTAAEWGVQLASEDARDAALAVRLAARGRAEARLGLAIAVTPALVVATAAAFGLAPIALIPASGLLGTIAALTRIRALSENISDG